MNHWMNYTNLHMKKTFISPPNFSENPQSPAYWFAFRQNELLVNAANASPAVPFLESVDQLRIPLVRQQFLGFLNDRPCFSAELDDHTEPPEGMAFQGLRALFRYLDENVFVMAGRAIQIVHWDRTNRFCGQCGTPLENSREKFSKECPRCGLASFPRISPAVIMLVSRGDKLLLARSPRFRENMYSVLAGFVEPGETLEEAVAREVLEECGIQVKNIRYFGSQPWPFPHSLMIGFTAKYAGGEITIDGEEIMDAGWFSVDNLPQVPDKISIARKLIDWFVEQQK